MKSASLTACASRPSSERSVRRNSRSRRSTVASLRERSRDCSSAIADFYSAGTVGAKVGVGDGGLVSVLETLWRREPDDCQRRQFDRDRMRVSPPWNRRSLHAAQVANVAAAVYFRVGVENLAIEAGSGYRDSESTAQHRREVAYADHAASGARRDPHEC